MEATQETSIKTKHPLKYFQISGGAHDRGFEYGERCKGSISHFIDTFYAEFKEKKNLSKAEILRYASRYTPYIEEYSPEVMEEMKGVAEGSGRQLEELVMVSLHEEKLGFTGGCTTLAASGSATVGGEAYMGQNWDTSTDVWWDGDMPCLLEINRGSSPDVLAYAYPGMQSNAGMNSKGISISWNSVPRVELRVGVPTYIIITELLRQRTIGDAIDSILRANRAGCFNFVVGDKTEIYNIEATPSDIDIQYIETCMGHANHFVSNKLAGLQDMSKIKASTIIRHNRMNRMLNEKCGEIDLEACMNMLRDHVNFPFSICSHPEPEREKKSLTWASWVQVPKKREWWISHGPPCKNEYKKYTI